MMRWLLYLPLYLTLMVLRYPLAAIAVAAFSTDDKRHLTFFRWLETIDNDLSGDDGWKEEHLIGSDPLSYINRVRWLWRNGGNSVNYGLLGCAEGDARFWMYRRAVPMGSRFIDLFFGWNLSGPKNGRCKYVCTIRVKTKL